MKRICFYTYTLVLFSFVSSCDRIEGETVETAYIEPLPEILKYQFSRNGSSSVDILERSLIDIPVDYIYSGYLKKAGINREYDYNRVMQFYEEGEDGYIPKQFVATSARSLPHQTDIQQDIKNIFDTSAKIGGYGSEDFFKIKSREARKGLTGYIGYDVGDLNLAYADEKGLVVAEAYRTMMLGAIHLDKILNLHLDESILDNPALRTAHENTELIPGKNYTALEHHWDLAYGYYARWRPYAQPEGMIALKDSENKILNAFILGRYELGKFRYDEMKKHLEVIREELSKVVAIRAMHFLAGQNTLANLKEKPGYSFAYLSEGYGLIYALQFTRKADGQPYLNYTDVKQLQQRLLQGDGFWEVNRLISDINTEGSLLNIANEIGKTYSITLDGLKR